MSQPTTARAAAPRQVIDPTASGRSLVGGCVGRRPLMLAAGALSIVALALPMLNLLQDNSTGTGVRFAVVFLAGAIVGLMAGPGPAMLSEMFHTRVRYTGLGLGHSLSNTVFAGSAGLVITEATKATGNKDIPAYHVIATCVPSALALASLRRDDHEHPLPR